MKVFLTFFSLLLFSLNTYAAKGTHGMVLFGKEQLMAYHLPMFHKMHAKQVVIHYTLPLELKEKIQSYEGNHLLTFVPEPFDLDLFLAEPHPLKGDVYLGHFEKDGEVIMTGVTLENTNVLYQQDLIKPQGLVNYYAFFGTPSDLYQVHLLDGGLPVDHIIKASVETSTPLNSYLFYGIKTSSPDLLNENDVSTVEIKYQGHCRLRVCPTITKKINVTSEKTYFKDDVM